MTYLRESCAEDDDEDCVSFSFTRLAMLGLLYCQDQSKPKEKAIQLYNLLQDGGVTRQPEIAAADKDFEPNMNTLLQLASGAALRGSG